MRYGIEVKNPVCPKCGSVSRTTKTKYGDRHSCEPCGLWSWNGKPLVDAETHEARRIAHDAFDETWKRGPRRVFRWRPNAYTWLARVLGIPTDDAHIALMGPSDCGRVVTACESLQAEHGR